VHELDELTLERARRGDRAAQASLIECYGGRVYALCGRMLVGRRSGEVDDVAQDALVKVLRGLPRFDPDGPAKLSTWVLTIAARSCIDALRQPAPAAPLDRKPAGDDDPERTTAQRQLCRRVRRAMAALPAEQRAVLVLRAFHDLDPAEVAAALRIAPGTVKSRTSRARAALRRALAGDDEERR